MMMIQYHLRVEICSSEVFRQDINIYFLYLSFSSYLLKLKNGKWVKAKQMDSLQ